MNFSVSASIRMVAKSMLPPAIIDWRRKLRRAAAKLVPAATAKLSQRRLEAVLGVSPGYLSRIKSQSGQPSSLLVALLRLLTQPGTAAELERFFAFLGCPENLG